MQSGLMKLFRIRIQPYQQRLNTSPFAPRKDSPKDRCPLLASCLIFCMHTSRALQPFTELTKNAAFLIPLPGHVFNVRRVHFVVCT